MRHLVLQILQIILFEIAQASITVVQPISLVDRFRNIYPQSSSNQIPSSLGNFGNPPYGSYLIGHAFYTQTIQNNLACGRLQGVNLENYNHDKVNVAILLVDRGSCSFAQKVIHAQEIGARAVIVVDNLNEDVQSIIMGDDGAGGNIAIPSFLINYRDGMLIKEAILNSQNDEDEESEVILNLRFEMQNPTKNVD